jgi:hypothetical protein
MYLSSKERIFSWALSVGYSRWVDPNGVYIYADQSKFDSVKKYLMEGKTYTRNIVYPELFPRQ